MVGNPSDRIVIEVFRPTKPALSTVVTAALEQAGRVDSPLLGVLDSNGAPE